MPLKSGISVAKNVRKHSEKMAAVCPHCGFTQEESVLAKSTFCRKCQQHYNLERMLAGEKSIVKEPGLFAKLSRFVLGDREREVTCFTCSNKQKLSKEAQSTMCAGCGAYMDLRDFKIAGPFGRSVQTAGDVHITSKGDVNSTRLMCGAIYIEGSLRGCVICTGTATLHFKGRLAGSLDAAPVLVDKRSEVDFPKPVRTKLFEVNGKATGEIIADKVVINKGGRLEGIVHAKAITVDKGGIFSGELIIGGGADAPAEPAPTHAEPIESIDPDDASEPNDVTEAADAAEPTEGTDPTDDRAADSAHSPEPADATASAVADGHRAEGAEAAQPPPPSTPPVPSPKARSKKRGSKDGELPFGP